MNAWLRRLTIRREIMLLYVTTLVVTAGLTLLQGSVSWLRAYLLVIVAGLFLYLPLEVLHRRGVDPADLGIHRKQPMRILKWALLAMLLTFPPYLVGFHGWQVWWQGNGPAVAEARMDAWPIEMEGVPVATTLREGEVRLFEAHERMWLRWHLPAGQRFEGQVTSDAAIKAMSGPGRVQDGGLKIEGGSDGRASFKVRGQTLHLDIKAGGDRLPAERLRLGSALTAADEVPFKAERSYWWLLNLVMVQLLLVALPEEVFYRGYLQTRLDGLVGKDRKILGVQLNPTSVVLTSALFAIGHFVTIPSPQRLAVFFPSLLFGWLRRGSGGIGAAVVFHAACNILVEVAVRFYAT